MNWRPTSGGRTSTDQREEGLNWLIGLLTTGKNLMLMYPAENPGECNRHHIIAIELLKRGVDAIHVLDDQLTGHRPVAVTYIIL